METVFVGNWLKMKDGWQRFFLWHFLDLLYVEEAPVPSHSVLPLACIKNKYTHIHMFACMHEGSGDAHKKE